jgi:glycosyltransferase involved in cell wall biosynthesis
MQEKLLLVTFPVDLGNKTFEKRFIQLFENHLDLKVHRFIPDQKITDTFLKYSATIGRRLLASFELQQKVREANQEGRKVLFQGISPALFAYPATQRDNSYIVTEWTRKLYEPIVGTVMSSSWHTFIHKQVLNAQRYVIGLSDAVVEEIAKDYDVPYSRLKKARVPFSTDLDLMIPSPNRNDDTIRILFVGGDFQRKGGDVLLDWFVKHRNPNLQLTMLTRNPIEGIEGVTVKTNVQHGQPEYIELYKNHDIFVLPTTCDSYPNVIGEAACAGLAVVTTQYALGAPEVIQNGVNGYICDSQAELFKQLSLLIENRPLIESMKVKSREFMEKEFSTKVVLNDFVSCIFGN